MVDIDAHEAPVSIIVEDNTRGDLPGLGARPSGKLDIE
jgi:hypothetical protein